MHRSPQPPTRLLARTLMLIVALAMRSPESLTCDGTWGHAEAAQPEWRAEFDEVCSKTQDAMALSVEELKALVARCDRLKAAIEQSDDIQRKVFSKRLKGCRDLYQFVLYSKQGS